MSLCPSRIIRLQLLKPLSVHLSIYLSVIKAFAYFPHLFLNDLSVPSSCLSLWTFSILFYLPDFVLSFSFLCKSCLSWQLSLSERFCFFLMIQLIHKLAVPCIRLHMCHMVHACSEALVLLSPSSVIILQSLQHRGRKCCKLNGVASGGFHLELCVYWLLRDCEQGALCNVPWTEREDGMFVMWFPNLLHLLFIY